MKIYHLLILFTLIRCSGSTDHTPIIIDHSNKIEFDNENQMLSYCIGLDHGGGSYSAYHSTETKDKFDIDQIHQGMVDYLRGEPLRIPFDAKDSIFDLYLLPEGKVDENAVTKVDASYAIGMDEAYMLVSGLVGRRIDQTIDVEYLIKGVNDALDHKEPTVTYVQASKEIALYYADLNLTLGQQFLTENQYRDSVVTTETGLQYIIFAEGNNIRPNLTDTVVVHYTARFIDGREFESTVPSQTPRSMTLLGLIPGWQEGLLLMSEGSEFRFFMSSDLGYGKEGNGAVEPNSALVYDIELIKVKRFN